MGNFRRPPKILNALTSISARSSLLFFTGLALTIREALLNGPERPSLYILYAGMMGLPFVWGGNRPEPPPDKKP